MILYFVVVCILFDRTQQRGGSSPGGKFKKGIFCDACDLLKRRYCFEQRCDRSHFCYRTETASGCSNPYMHNINECRRMHRGDCCYARQDLHGSRFNTSACVHEIPQVMCHECTRLGGCEPVSCKQGSYCYANRFESGCSNMTSYAECTDKFERCCEGRTSLKAWNATECQAEAAPICEHCPIQPSDNKLTNCTTAKCPGLCFKNEVNVTTLDGKGKIVTLEYMESGCTADTLDVTTCNTTHSVCCTSSNNTDCYYNYNPNPMSVTWRFFLTFGAVSGILTVVLTLCFTDFDK